jgi:HlyD family secretion protein
MTVTRKDEQRGVPKPVLVQPSKPASAVEKSGKRKGIYRIVFWATVAAGVTAAVAAYWYLTTPVVETVSVSRQDVVHTLVASGHVETPFRIQIASQVVGTVAEVLVDEGQSVNADEVLIRLGDAEALENLAQAQSTVAQYEMRLAQLRDVAARLANESLRQAEANLQDAQKHFDRTNQLARKGIASLASLDTARRARDVARSQVDSAALQVATNQPGGRDYQLAETQLAQAKASVRSSQAKLAYYEIRSPRDGVLISRTVEKGSVVQPGASLMVLAPAGETQLVAQIDELNLALVRLGQEAKAVADAFPQETFDADVSYINPRIDPERGSVEVKLTVPNPPGFLVQDMTVSIEMIAARLRDTIALETTDVNEPDTSAPWVWKLEDKVVKKQLIKLGLAGDTAVAVVSGLSLGDQIVKGAAMTLEEGQRVRVKADEQ